MGELRNGARSFLDVIAKACRLSHLPGFRGGITKILGTEDALVLFAVWDPFCAAVDLLIEADNWYNKRDTVEDNDGTDSEDQAVVL